MNEVICIVEDDPTTSLLYSSWLRKENYEPITFSGIQSFLSFLDQNHKFHLLLTDLHLSDGDAVSLIRKVRESYPKLPILVVSADDKKEALLSVITENVQEYCIKPLERKEFLQRIRYHLQRIESDFQKQIYEKEKVLSLEKLLEWYSYKNQRLSKGEFDSRELNKNLFHSLRASLSQGAGFGILAQLIDLIKGLEKTSEGNYIVPSDVLKILEDNANYAQKVLDRLAEIESVLFEDAVCEEISIVRWHDEFQNLIETLRPKLAIKANTLRLSQLESRHKDLKILWNSEFLSRVVRELMLNACRFSQNGSEITILYHLEKDHLSISFINSLDQTLGLGNSIPMEYLDLLFEPFFRLTKNIYENYGSLDFGLGLTYVKEAVQKFGGSIHVLNLVSHLEEVAQEKVEFRWNLPYASKK